MTNPRRECIHWKMVYVREFQREISSLRWWCWYLRDRMPMCWERAWKKKLAPWRNTTTPVHPNRKNSSIFSFFSSWWSEPAERAKTLQVFYLSNNWSNTLSKTLLSIKQSIKLPLKNPSLSLSLWGEEFYLMLFLCLLIPVLCSSLTDVFLLWSRQHSMPVRFFYIQS